MLPDTYEVYKPPLLISELPTGLSQIRCSFCNINNHLSFEFGNALTIKSVVTPIYPVGRCIGIADYGPTIQDNGTSNLH